MLGLTRRTAAATSPRVCEPGALKDFDPSERDVAQQLLGRVVHDDDPGAHFAGLSAESAKAQLEHGRQRDGAPALEEFRRQRLDARVLAAQVLGVAIVRNMSDLTGLGPPPQPADQWPQPRELLPLN